MTIKHSTIYELTHPFSGMMMSFYNKAIDARDQWQVNRMKKQVLHRKLNNLTDPTFLDRAVRGESK